METVRLDRETSQTTAPNGVIVLSERVPSVRSAAVGIWVRSASAHEPRPKMGVSHLLEHMVFKGTERRTAQQIALAARSTPTRPATPRRSRPASWTATCHRRWTCSPT